MTDRAASRAATRHGRRHPRAYAFARLAALAGVLAVAIACAGGREPTRMASRIEVAVTIDDLPRGRRGAPAARPEAVKALADVLTRHGVPPTYGFVIGSLVEQPADRATLEAWLAAGQRIGNHTYSHVYARRSGDVPAFLADLDRNEPLLAELAGGSDWKVFRFPYLREPASRAERLELRRQLAARGYRVAEVTIDFWDYAWSSPRARCTASGDARATRALRTTYVDYGVSLLRWADAAARRALGRRIPQVLLLHADSIDAATLDALLTAYETQAHVRWIPLERAMADPAYRLDADGRRAGRAGSAGWRSIGFQERLPRRTPDRWAPYPQHPTVPLALLRAVCPQSTDAPVAHADAGAP